MIDMEIGKKYQWIFEATRIQNKQSWWMEQGRRRLFGVVKLARWRQQLIFIKDLHDVWTPKTASKTASFMAKTVKPAC